MPLCGWPVVCAMPGRVWWIAAAAVAWTAPIVHNHAKNANNHRSSRFFSLLRICLVAGNPYFCSRMELSLVQSTVMPKRDTPK